MLSPGGVFGERMKHVLGSGARLVVDPVPGAPVTAVYLYISAGASEERPEQHGAAHFLEHMCFKGSPELGVGEVATQIEAMGGDVNAYTSFDETVYQLQVPTDGDGETFTTGLDVLREWAGSVTISDEEVEKERGVVLEEQRLGKGAFERIQDIQFPILFNNSRYAERLPIGTAEVLQTAPAQRLRDFYEDWYLEFLNFFLKMIL